MSEQTTTTEATVNEATEQAQGSNQNFNPFSETSWVTKDESEQSEPSPKPEDGNNSASSQQTTEQQQSNAATSNEQDEVVDLDEYIKREIGVENFGSLKTEIEELRKLKESATTKEEIKFANEQSQKFFEYLKEGKEDELYSHLDTKRKLNKVSEMPALDALKLQIELQNKNYSKQDIEDIIEERYTFPEKPEKDALDDDDEYQGKLDKWQSQVDKIKRRIERDALIAKEDLAKLNQELVLPDIPTQKQVANQNQPSQEELDKVEKVREAFLSKLDADYKNFSGYQMKYKDEEVEIPVTFGISDEEKSALKTQLADFNVEDFLLSRWFEANGEPKINQMMDDITLLTRKEDVLQKMINEVGTKMKEHYIKVKANVNVNGRQQAPANENENNLQAQIAHIWNTK